MTEKMLGFEDMAEACGIFAKYDFSYNSFNCSHNELTVCVDPNKVDKEDVGRLSLLGFEADFVEGYFYSFRFGSC